MGQKRRGRTGNRGSDGDCGFERAGDFDGVEPADAAGAAGAGVAVWEVSAVGDSFLITEGHDL
jgi:hypothetical protein